VLIAVWLMRSFPLDPVALGRHRGVPYTVVTLLRLAVEDTRTLAACRGPYLGDPPVANSGDSTTVDERVFLGNALTVYGRNGTKLATAFNHGAAAVLLVPSTPPFRYVWENNARENMTLRDGNERQQLKAQALISIDKAATIFAATGNDLERARTAAAAPGFRAVALSARVTITVINQVRRFESQNILAKIEGSDPALKNEYVIYSGHWDHHGREGNRIFHGASTAQCAPIRSLR
jgi:hypothetical protein